MADNTTETENAAPEGTVTSTIKAGFDSLKKFTADFGKKAFEHANATPAPKVQGPLALPTLTESMHTGYSGWYDKKTKTAHVTAKQITCCAIGPYLAEKSTAYDYILMSNAAAIAGISLPINSGFRTMEEQTALWIERSNPQVALDKGVAAYPGTSNHQSGHALDIHVGLKKAQYIAGERTAAYLWLEAHAAAFGFDHVEGASVNEPWHWTHLGSTIVGTSAPSSATMFSALVVDTAVNAAASDQSGTARLNNLEGHDETTSWSRAASAAGGMSRQNALKEGSVFKANMSRGVTNRVSQLEATKLVMAVDSKAFVFKTVAKLVFDFKTGLWGDGKPV